MAYRPGVLAVGRAPPPSVLPPDGDGPVRAVGTLRDLDVHGFVEQARGAVVLALA
jgi:hypothetical protein